MVVLILVDIFMLLTCFEKIQFFITNKSTIPSFMEKDKVHIG